MSPRRSTRDIVWLPLVLLGVALLAFAVGAVFVAIWMPSWQWLATGVLVGVLGWVAIALGFEL